MREGGKVMSEEQLVGEVVPFGKYRDRPVAELLADRNYVDWLLAQPWFKQRQSVVYNIVVGAGGSEAADTPEHNAMQARFLDLDLCRRLGRRYIASEEQLQRPEHVGNGSYVMDVTTPRLEDGGWDVRFEAYADTHQGAHLARGDCAIAEHDTFALLHIELKPVIADDYPTVLRQVLARRTRDCGGHRPGVFSRWLVITDRLTPSSVAPAQVRSVFASQQVELLMFDEINQRALPSAS